MKQLRIKVYGVLVEIVGASEIIIPVDSFSVPQLMDYLMEKYPAMKLVQCKLAVNHRICEKGSLTSEDSLVLMPPFAGG